MRKLLFNWKILPYKFFEFKGFINGNPSNTFDPFAGAGGFSIGATQKLKADPAACLSYLKEFSPEKLFALREAKQIKVPKSKLFYNLFFSFAMKNWRVMKRMPSLIFIWF